MRVFRNALLAVRALRQHASGRRDADRAPLRADEILAKVVELPVSTWSYMFEPAEITRCGPMAQDFWEAFGFGSTDKRIPVESAIGVLMVSVQVLAHRLEAAERQLGVHAAVSEPALAADGR